MGKKGLDLEVPGRGRFVIKNIVFDMNGTLTRDGRMRNKVKDRLILLAKKFNTYIITSDTFGKAEETFRKVPAEIIKVPEGKEADRFKRDFVIELGRDITAAVGNGYNDRLMMEVARISVCILGPEGAYGETLARSHVVFIDPMDAIDFFLKPLRFKATLRN